MERLVSDLRYALRRLARSPGFTLVAALTLALGIGLNGALFSLIDAVLLRPLPVEQPDQLVRIYSTVPKGFLSHGPLAYPDFADLRDDSQAMSEVAAYALTPLALADGGASRLIYGELVSGSYFATLGARPALGRLLAESDDRPGSAQAVAVLNHDLWRRQFAADPAVLGRAIHLGGQAFTIVGVAAPEFQGLTRGLAPELWIPIGMATRLPEGVAVGFGKPTPGLDRLSDRSRRWVWAVGRLAPSAGLTRLDAELESFAGRWAAEYPATHRERGFAALPAAQVDLLPGVDNALERAAWVLWAVTALVLLVASVNVANLLLARAVGRRREIATRLSLGAARSGLLRQLLVESLLLALLGAALGWLLAHWAVAGVAAIELPAQWPIPIDLDLALGGRSALFTLLVAVATVLVFGLAPALEALRGDLVSALRDGSAGNAGRSATRLQGTLVGAQVALSLVLLIGSGLTLRSLGQAQAIDPGFDPAGVVVATFAPELAGLDMAEAEAFFDGLERRIGAVPGVRSVASASHLPLRFAIQFGRVAASGQDLQQTESWRDADLAVVGPGYFETLSIPLLSGRAFDAGERSDGPPRVVVNQTLAAALWPERNAVGERLHLAGTDEPYEVIGVAGDGKYRTLGDRNRPFVYRAVAQTPLGTRTLLARTAGEPGPVLEAIRRVAGEVDAGVPISGLETYRSALGGTLLLPRLAAGMFGSFGLLGLLLAAVGIYGVVAYAVSQSTREVGIRMALGADRGDILRWVVGRGLRSTLIGLVVGVLISFAAAGALRAVLYGVSPTDPLTFLVVTLLLGGVAFVACLLPARRAADLAPLDALRHE